MLMGIVGTLILASVAGLLWMLLRKVWRKGGAVRWVSSPFVALFAVLFTIFSFAAVRGIVRGHKARGRPVREMTVLKDSARVARGEHIARVTCAGCHSVNYDIPMSGGKNLSDEAHMPLGDIVPFNLTPGGPLKDWSDGEIFRAIREAADKDRKALVVMTGQGGRLLSDEDIESVIAFLRSQPAVTNETKPERLSLLTYMMAGLNMLPMVDELAPEKITAPPRGVTVEYGDYVITWAGCRECHGATLSGGVQQAGPPPGPTLHTVKGWPEEGFIAAMRTGKTPFGKQLDSMMMPWKGIGRMDDDELKAVYLYLKEMPAPPPPAK
jgi:mono/diheme cytochrome c family protein